MFSEIPTTPPCTPLLTAIDRGRPPGDLDAQELTQLAQELRAYLLYSVGQSGGHFGAGLGVVELTIALHHVFNTPDDRIVWDVGHQTYPHKILTGRMQQMHSMRHAGGLSGFPKRSESEYDTFGVGHSSTSISAAMGMALAARQQGLERKVIAVIGDGAITGGMAFEALAHAGHERPDMLVILNDNQMSIGHNEGGLATYFAKIWATKTYLGMRERSKRFLERFSFIWKWAKRTEEHMKGMVAPSTMFEELGFHYIGPLDGHDLPQLVKVLENMKDLEGPQFLHIRTVKGKGYTPAEEDPVGYHALNKVEAKSPGPQPAESPAPKPPKYQDVFGQWLCDMAEQDPQLVGITPAMCEGSGMVAFAERFPRRYYDVAIAEQHAVTLAAGMACDGLKPVVAIYSTFLQRGYDQLIHDVALQNLDVTFAIDRAGLVGQDGPTHHGAFDLSYLRCIPNMVIGAPSDENECRQMLYTAYQHPGPAAVRYPRGTGTGVGINETMAFLEIGKSVNLLEGSGVAILNFGTLLPQAREAAESLGATLVDMRWVKPLDEAALANVSDSHDLLVTVEENATAGGAGAAVSEFLAKCGDTTAVLHLGIPDEYIEHGDHHAQLTGLGLDADGIALKIKRRLALIDDTAMSAATAQKTNVVTATAVTHTS
ncbi:1-deoxy-D-xylulose-5-phosphate synthase [Pseudohalioglobus lutimaris]|uniref:1-deoxy-D-xylulose-5-phosphate synthase n=1 Tax=Pseudohalioglobus lutimaris TaxID=1737061 RepID=A0A2N5X2E5_9GAMM|nr:1-deoxy-D-xylulose-5-phosphate synthase [Pseudohalioglobus lutimaris]PLW68664.1 1-deoxy-D-xylulose-5-phosphate synthase [Pseudohalioglobus lutimaris]